MPTKKQASLRRMRETVCNSKTPKTMEVLGVFCGRQARFLCTHVRPNCVAVHSVADRCGDLLRTISLMLRPGSSCFILTGQQRILSVDFCDVGAPLLGTQITVMVLFESAGEV